MVTVLIAALLQAMPAVAAPVLALGETLLEVTSSGEAKAVPDVAEFSTGVTSDGVSARAALAANAATTERLVAAIAGAGVADGDLRTSELGIRPRYKPDKEGNDTDEIVGYRATSRLTVRARAVDRAAALVDALVKAGATDLSGPSFSFSDEAPLAARARDDAITKAQREAADYARALGLRVSRILRVSERARRGEGVDEIVVTANKMSAPIKPGEQSVNVTVWVDYALAPR